MEDKVRFNRESLTIDIQVHPHYVYDIDLERCTDSAGLLDWILQVSNKTWCDGDLLKQLLECLRDAAWECFHTTLQGLYCPFGESKSVDWAAQLKNNRRVERCHEA